MLGFILILKFGKNSIQFYSNNKAEKDFVSYLFTAGL